jgi:hypothetical protein
MQIQSLTQSLSRKQEKASVNHYHVSPETPNAVVIKASKGNPCMIGFHLNINLVKGCALEDAAADGCKLHHLLNAPGGVILEGLDASLAHAPAAGLRKARIHWITQALL